MRFEMGWFGGGFVRRRAGSEGLVGALRVRKEL